MPHQPRLLADDPTPARPAQDDAERAAYRERLAAWLQDPAGRQVEGFPLADDEAILALSDPPYYTACPNPFLPEILARWQAERDAARDERPKTEDQDLRPEDRPSSFVLRPASGYHRDPFAADVSEGKNDPIYNAHSYHTKVPHKAVMRYILHYTEPGDIVFDGFCGTGMTGVAAQLCGDRAAVESLGYYVDGDGWVWESRPGTRDPHPLASGPSPLAPGPHPLAPGPQPLAPISRLGARKAVLVDLSPAATFIAYNYNTPVDVAAFEREARRILAEVEAECGWMYETWHPHADAPDRVKGRINYTVWSEVFHCPNCSREITFLNEALDLETKRVREEFPCPQCGATLGKRDLERRLLSHMDPALNTLGSHLDLRPVLIEYTVGNSKFTKRPDSHDMNILARLEHLPIPATIPTNPLPIEQMYHGSRLAPKGVTHIHHFFLPRARQALNALWTKAQAIEDTRLRNFLLFTVEQAIWGMSLLARYAPTHFSQVNQYLAGVYYISSLISEVSPWYILDGKTKRLAQAFGETRLQVKGAAITTQSASVGSPLPESIDYIFTDPPFGENIYYADLNYLVESWHGVRTNSGPEAIIDQAKRKDLYDYQDLMRQAFRSFYGWLKAGRWMTVEFHNSHNAVWNAIQEALTSAGFVVADVRTLDKQQASYRQVTANTVAKQDLVISAYKPTEEFERRFGAEAGTERGAWDFVQEHLGHLPLPPLKDGRLQVLAERQPYLLYDRMVAFHIQRGLTVPLGAADFYAGLRRRFAERDGMTFLPPQAAAYEALKLQAQGVEQLPLLVVDEKTARAWLRQTLDAEPLTYQDLQPRFLRELHQAGYEKLPELREVLEEGFLQDDAGRWYVPDPGHAADLARLREKALLREFEAYREGRGRLRVFRSEAVRAGFHAAWRARDYRTIVEVAERLPERVLQEDPDLLMYYDNASLRLAGA